MEKWQLEPDTTFLGSERVSTHRNSHSRQNERLIDLGKISAYQVYVHKPWNFGAMLLKVVHRVSTREKLSGGNAKTAGVFAELFCLPCLLR